MPQTGKEKYSARKAPEDESKEAPYLVARTSAK
jgi:hypothetical protein